MSSELYLYSENLFNNHKYLKIILQVIADRIANPKKFTEDLYFIGNFNIISNFIQILKSTSILKGKLVYFSDYILNPNEEYYFIILDEEKQYQKLKNIPKIFIQRENHFCFYNYFIKNNQYIPFQPVKNYFDIEIIIFQLEILLIKYINFFTGYNLNPIEMYYLTFQPEERISSEIMKKEN